MIEKLSRELTITQLLLVKKSPETMSRLGITAKQIEEAIASKKTQRAARPSPTVMTGATAATSSAS